MAGVSARGGSRTVSTRQGAVATECHRGFAYASISTLGVSSKRRLSAAFIRFKEKRSGARGLLSIDERHSSSCKPIKSGCLFSLRLQNNCIPLCVNVYVSALLFFPKKSLLS